MKQTDDELVKLKKDISKEVEKNTKVFKEWVEKTFPIGAKVSFLGREMYVYDLWEPTTRWSGQHDFSVICAWWDNNTVQKIILSRKEVGDGIPWGPRNQVCRLLFPIYLNDKVEKLKEERKIKKYCYGD